jgi:hypothetical protein
VVAIGVYAERPGASEEARVVRDSVGIVCKQQCEMQVRGAAYE